MAKIIGIFILVFLSVNVTAQKMNFGIKGGINVSNQEIKGIAAPSGGQVSSNSIIGYYAGCFINVKPIRKVGVQPELLLNSVGSEQYSSMYRYNYLSLPLMFKFYPVNIINVYVGPQFSYFLSENIKYDYLHSPYASSDNRPFETALSFGVGLELPFGLIADVRYTKGLSNTLDPKYNSDIKNKYIQIGLGYKLFGK